MNGFDQRLIDGDRDVIGKERPLDGGGISADFCVIIVIFYGTGIGRGEGIAEAGESAVIHAERRFPNRPVRRFAEDAEGPVRQGSLLPALILHVREREIDRLEHVEDIGRSAGSVTEKREHLFSLFIQRMNPRTNGIVEDVKIIGKTGILPVRFKDGLLEGEDFRIKEGNRSGERNIKGKRLSLHLLIIRIAVVLTLAEVGIKVDEGYFFRGLVQLVQRTLQGIGGSGECPAQGGKFGNGLLGFPVSGFPCGTVCEDRREIPADGRIQRFLI